MPKQPTRSRAAKSVHDLAFLNACRKGELLVAMELLDNIALGVRLEVEDKDGNVKIKRRKIYDTTIDKAREMVNVYREFNLTNDTDLEDARAKLEMALRGVTVEELREGEVSRVQVKDAVDDILSKFAPRVAVI